MLVHDFLCGSMGIPKHLSTRRRIFTGKPRLALQLVAADHELSLADTSDYLNLPYIVRLLDLSRLVIDLSSLVIASTLV